MNADFHRRTFGRSSADSGQFESSQKFNGPKCAGVPDWDVRGFRGLIVEGLMA